MSHDWKYEFHMGCGEPLSSQWNSQVALLLRNARKGQSVKAKKPVPHKGAGRGGRRG